MKLSFLPILRSYSGCHGGRDRQPASATLGFAFTPCRSIFMLLDQVSAFKKRKSPGSIWPTGQVDDVGQ
ncbi:hypothetical protein [Mesorhizobium sp. B2-3-4]|uniref:hypothetical protein n=1 Tax=Mesorhizobium sp. B2-3-4 TaxID=2589959 RepID=UPI0015E37166|nr:hypothetical protein [Mesorhizobium sp. B2-3-4]